MPSSMLKFILLATWIACLTSALSFPPIVSHLSSRGFTDPTSEGIMALSSDFVVSIGDGTQLLPMLLDSAHPCTFLVGSDIQCANDPLCGPSLTYSPSNDSWLHSTSNSRTCQYGEVAKQPPSSVSGISAAGYLGFAEWTPDVDNIIIANSYDSPGSLNSFLSGASGILSIFGSPDLACNISAVSLNYWPDNVESDGTFLYMAPRRSSMNGPGLISWGTTPNDTLLGTSNWNLTTTVAKTNISGNDTTARAQSCAYTIPVDKLSLQHNETTISEMPISQSGSTNFILATMSQFNVVGQEFASDIAAAFEPAGSQSSNGLIQVACDAVPPNILATIGGVDLVINSVDMIVSGEDGVCYSAFQAAADWEVWKLGQPFLKNVAMRVGWDLGVEFTSRPYYAP